MANTSKISEAETPKTRRLRAKFRSYKFLTGLIILVLLAVGGYFAYKDHQSRNDVARLSSDPQAAAKQAVSDTVTKVSRMAQLPANETPTLATVNDISKLQNQTFFKSARNGDKVLIYTQSKLAILYRPSTDKVINIAPLNIGNNSDSTNSGTTSGQ